MKLLRGKMEGIRVIWSIRMNHKQSVDAAMTSNNAATNHSDCGD